MKLTRSLIPVLLLGASLAIAQMTPEVAFRAARETETVKGDLKAAIEQYRKIAHGRDRVLAAKALLRIAGCYVKLGQSEAEAVYHQVLRDYSDQAESTAEARRRLAALRSKGPAEKLSQRMLCGNCGDSAAQVSSDGRWMAMTDWDSGDLAIRDMSTMQFKRLMLKPGGWKEDNDGNENDPYAEFPRISPDGRQIAYLWEPEIKGRPAQLRIVSPEQGAKPRVVLENPEFTYYTPSVWSLDGKSVLTVFLKNDRSWQIGWVSASNGEFKILKSLGWRLRNAPVRARLSPDGRFIAYSALTVNPKDAGGPLQSLERRIYLLASDGSSETELVKTAGINLDPVWTPDGSHILFTSNLTGSPALWSVKVSDGKAVAPPSMVSEIAGEPLGMSGNGTYYYSKRQIEAAKVSIAGLAPGDSTIQGQGWSTKAGLIGVLPSWSPDGKLLAFSRNRGPAGTNQWNLIVHSLETGEEISYPFDGARTSPPRWFRDRKAVAITANQPGKPRTIYRVDLDTKQLKEILEIPPDRYGPSFEISHDEKTVYVSAINPEEQGALVDRILAVDVSTGKQQLVFQAATKIQPLHFRLSPDGRTLAVRRLDPVDGRTHIGVVSVDGKGYRELKTAGFVPYWGSMAWTHDGRGVLVPERIKEDWRLIRLPLDGGAAAPAGLQGAGDLQGIDVSPNGKRVAFSSSKTVSELWAVGNMLSVLQ